MGLLDSILGKKDPDLTSQEEWLRRNETGGAPVGNNAPSGAGIDKTNSEDDRKQDQTSSSSGGEGGLFGNASANLGDVGFGNSSATSGDAFSSINKDFTISGPTINKSPAWLPFAAVGFGLLFFLKGRK